MYERSDTLDASYLRNEYWVIEVEVLVWEGLGQLRIDPDSRGGAAMVAEAYQRLLQKRWARELQLKNRGWFARFYRPSGRECHHKALESMAQGILYHYGWDHFAKEAAMLARNEQPPVVRVFVSIHVDLENPVCPNRFQTKLP